MQTKLLQAVTVAFFIGIFSTLTYANPPKTCKDEISVPFQPGIPFNGLNITNQYQQYGIIFTAEDIQENVIFEGNFFNPSQINFLGSVCKVTVVIKDWNGNPQKHTLVAYDKWGEVLVRSTINDDGLVAMPFLITVKHQNIASVAIVNEPNGTTQLLSVTYGR